VDSIQEFDRNNSLLVNSQDTQTNFTPAFVDIQTNINYQASKMAMEFFGEYISK
jgi:hypothetical protein